MTPSQIIQWRKEACRYASQNSDSNEGIERWARIADERFAQLVTQHEREQSPTRDAAGVEELSAEGANMNKNLLEHQARAYYLEVSGRAMPFLDRKIAERKWAARAVLVLAYAIAVSPTLWLVFGPGLTQGQKLSAVVLAIPAVILGLVIAQKAAKIRTQADPTE